MDTALPLDDLDFGFSAVPVLAEVEEEGGGAEGLGETTGWGSGVLKCTLLLLLLLLLLMFGGWVLLCWLGYGCGAPSRPPVEGGLLNCCPAPLLLPGNGIMPDRSEVGCLSADGWLLGAEAGEPVG